MNLQQYTKLAIRTAATPIPNYEDRELNIVHALLGIQTEVNELMLECTEPYQFKEELGDLFWYCALAAHTLNLTLEDIELLPVDSDDPETHLQKQAMVCADLAKRILFYRTPVEDFHIAQLIGQVLSSIELLINCYHLELEDVLYSNINKLMIRFPKVYSDHCAVNRNTEKEKKALV
jgi:hypothetical protein